MKIPTISFQPKPPGVDVVNRQKLAPKNHVLLPGRTCFSVFHTETWPAVKWCECECFLFVVGVWAHQKKVGRWWRVGWVVSLFLGGVALWERWLKFLIKMHQHEFVSDSMWYNRREGCYIRLLSTTIKLFKVFGVEHFDFKGSETFQCMLNLSWKQEPLKPHLVICEDFLHHLHLCKRRSADILDQINSNLGFWFFSQLLNFLQQIYKWFRFNPCFTWAIYIRSCTQFQHGSFHHDFFDSWRWRVHWKLSYSSAPWHQEDHRLSIQVTN